MKFKNETKEDVVIPIIHDERLPSGKLIIKDGETKDVPEVAVEYAKTYGLTPVEDVPEEEVSNEPVPDEEIPEEPVEAEESSIAGTPVETKQIKSKKSNKRS